MSDREGTIEKQKSRSRNCVIISQISFTNFVQFSGTRRLTQTLCKTTKITKPKEHKYRRSGITDKNKNESWNTDVETSFWLALFDKTTTQNDIFDDQQFCRLWIEASENVRNVFCAVRLPRVSAKFIKDSRLKNWRCVLVISWAHASSNKDKPRK